MNLKQLRYFAEVARCGSQTSAAQRLNVSQPALGLQIRELEADLGVRLFHRRSRGMELTAAGKELLGRTDRVLRQMEEMRQAMRAFAEVPRRRLSLGTPPTPGKLLVPPLLRALASQEAVTLALHEGLSSDLAAHIRSGDLDLALTYDPVPDATRPSAVLAHDDLILVGPPGRLGGGEEAVSFRALGAFPMVMDSPKQITRRLLDKMAHQENVELQVVLEVDSVNLKREVILSQGCFAIVPRGLFVEALTEGRFAWAPIADPCITRTLYLMARRALPEEDFALILETLSPIVADYIRSAEVNWRRP
ncbi:LysR family transcriptional regulator [Celeribacter indicus]|uniref:Transcriptional regulator n=1 Tax=Celeribacter indicus TaxID=1208324 RepID=A0A0B5E5Y0_9RHOB|nr:LysR family transcriptional regulator [Celeribacter indicus]AJE48431.1 transcriptional regulator [Celeribacter indicus]SDX29515.1 LysR family transcriptional regulator, nitrogen assimilation regulatory protein [Celeribacter indicus]